MSTVKINLKEKILDYAGKEIKIIERTSVILSGNNSYSVNTSDLANAKPYTLGYALTDIFARKIKPKNIGDAAVMNKWHSRFFNKLTTDKGIIELDSDDLKDLKEILDTQTDPALLEVIIDGAVYGIITDYLAKALINKK